MSRATATVVRLTEHDLRLVEVSDDVELPPGADPNDAEDYLDGAADDVRRQTLRAHVEIISREMLTP